MYSNPFLNPMGVDVTGTLASEVVQAPHSGAIMQITDRSEALTAIRTDLGAIFVSLELSRSTWMITSLSPGAASVISIPVRGGDIALLKRFTQLQEENSGADKNSLR